MSDRYRPNGPRSGRDFQSHKGYKGSNYNNSNSSSGSGPGPTGNNRDTSYPTGPKRYSERDNYRPENGSGSSSVRPTGPSATIKPPSGPSSLRDKSSQDQSFKKRPLPAEPSGGTKRPLPSEPSGIRKRRELNSNYPSNDGYNNGYKSYKNTGYTSGYSNNYSERNYNNSNYPKDGYSNSNGYDNNRSRASSRRNNEYRNTKPLPNGPRGARKSPAGPKPNKLVTTRNFPKKLSSSQIYSVKVTNSIDVYKRIVQVGEGTYGKVYKAKNAVTDEYVALKKLRLETEREGFPITAIREIKLLQSFEHENIVGLLEIMVEHNQIYMIFDYLDHDLTGLLSHPDLILEECHRKFIFKQLMDGLNYLHKKRVLHRDIKGSNILLDNVGKVKIADFGLARTMKIVNTNELPDYTNRVITIWYRPPELLLGATDYGREIDIWGVGCLLLELYSKTAAFKGFDEVSQLCKIYNIMGTPNVQDWPDISNLPWFEMLKPKVNKSSQFDTIYEDLMSPASFDLAKKLLTLNPQKRLSAEEALQHPYFTEDPQPQQLDFLKDLQGEWHEFETKKRRRKERKRLQEEELKRESKSGSVTAPTTAPVTAPATVTTAPGSLPLTAPQSDLKEDINNRMGSNENTPLQLDVDV